MFRLRDEGKIKVIGLSARKDEDFRRLIPIIKPEVLQSFSNALDSRYLGEGKPVRKLLEENHISFVAFGPVAQGLLLGKYDKKNLPKFEDGDHRKNSPRFTVEYLEKLEPKLEILKQKFGSNVEDLSRAALQYLLHYQVVGAVIPGFRNLKQVMINLDAADKPLTDEEFNFIKELFVGFSYQ